MEKNIIRRSWRPVASVAGHFRKTARALVQRPGPTVTRLLQKAAIATFVPAAYLTLQSGGLAEKLALRVQRRNQPNRLSNGVGAAGMAAGAYGAYRGYSALAGAIIRHFTA